MSVELQLVGPAAGALSAPRLSADQQAVVDLPTGSGPVLVLGAPGTGKSTVLVEAAVARIERDGLDPSHLLMLAPSRLAAAGLRDALSARLQGTLSTAPARTWASYAFDLIRRAKTEGRLPYLTRAPKLLSGAEQDVIIKELLAGHGQQGVPELPWPDSLDLALGTRGFRQEIRQLFDRVIEYGISAEELRELGQRHGRPDWVAAAGLYAEYRDVLDLRMPESFDPAGIITSALNILRSDPEFLAAERERQQLVLVDDLQEANPAIHSLYALLAGTGDSIAAACPDTVVQGFRGARPDLVGQLGRRFDGRLETRVLTTSHRLTGSLAGAWTRTASRISVVGQLPSYRTAVADARFIGTAAGNSPADGGTPADAPQSEVPGTDAPHTGGSGTGTSESAASAAADVPAAGTAEAHVVDTPMHEQRYVAQRILEAQLLQGRSLEDIAVIVRTGAQLAALQRYLTGQGIEVKVPVAERAVRDEAAVRPLLDAFAVVLEPDLLTPELAVSLLTSRIGGASTLELRRLRQALRREERSAGGGRTSDALLVESLLDPESDSGRALAGLSWDARPAAQRISAMLAAGREAAREPGATAETVLWALWSVSGWSKRWAETALSGGPGASRADRDLDAIMALFQTAERYVDQLPGSTPAQFLDYLTSSELPMDTLAARAQRREAVELLTPASAAGREWPMVIVAGIQQDVWPNLRLRGELLGSGELVAAVEHGDNFRAHRSPLTLMQSIRFDELRSFSTAISRAREVLICTAVSSEDEQPSSFLDLVAPLEPGAEKRQRTEVLRPHTLRSLVAELRRYAQQPEEDPEAAAEAVHHLGTMLNHPVPVPGAHPGQWWGLAPLSSTAAILPLDAPIPVSPSKVDAVLKSPLSWFVSAAGGEQATDFARSLGTLVHAIAQDMPDAAGSEYVQELQKRWPSLGMKDNWEGQMDYQRAETMVRKLAEYVITMRRSGRSLVAVEKDFEVELPVEIDGAVRTALLRGQIDRLEADAEGRLFIVDLKTGKSAPKKDDLQGHPQLAAYQEAVREGALPDAPRVPGGAALVQLGTTNKGVSVQEQPPLDPQDTTARDMVRDAAALMSAAFFETVHDPGRSGFGGNGCRLPEICPLCAEGKQVTE
ncbi:MULTISPECIES: ATP-dependent DNA helicase [unclassified Arthrobacter]|uniref:ATP-dependent helicase n=1 Tax=unclassified Arthrobacter TaxID=235627 RepID=UPI001E3E0500|nr:MULTISPECIES: ATP-dependent DNA helicase [unclassified Arthrobacter]MCC9146410.1 ATP-dependent helicase [Arthrobacter sp. zg-Y919]MDK1277640.1 ATP-dependent DNA helicase [Arthrobacter sp. zg.Y919]WIB02398.1 ATP-dependent DNA helicase [Arthrobacter sp. zg-Y919]